MKTHELETKFIQAMKSCDGRANSVFAKFAEFFKITSIESAAFDSLSYCSGTNLNNDDPDSGEKEILELRCSRRIEFSTNSKEFFMLSVSLEYPLDSIIGSISTYQCDWCVDKSKIADFLADIKKDPLYKALENFGPQNVYYLAYPVKL